MTTAGTINCTFTLDEIDTVAQKLISTIGNATLLSFEGQMGVGKTTLIKAICRQLGVTDTVSSPTFSIINEYKNSLTGDPIYHFDFYRITDIDEAQQIGTEDYFDSGHLCLLEWAENITPLLPEETLTLTLREIAHNTRNITSKHVHYP